MTPSIPTIIHVSLFFFVLQFSFCFLFFSLAFCCCCWFLQVFFYIHWPLVLVFLFFTRILLQDFQCSNRAQSLTGRRSRILESWLPKVGWIHLWWYVCHTIMFWNVCSCYRQKDMLELTSSARIQVTSDNRGGATLTIRKVKVSDAGLYLVQAQSKSGRTKSSANLRVRGMRLHSYLLSVNSQTCKGLQILVVFNSDEHCERSALIVLWLPGLNVQQCLKKTRKKKRTVYKSSNIFSPSTRHNRLY